jgi:hypothetical protein
MIIEQIVNTQGGVIPPEEGEYGLAQPARIVFFLSRRKLWRSRKNAWGSERKAYPHSA